MDANAVNAHDDNSEERDYQQDYQHNYDYNNNNDEQQALVPAINNNNNNNNNNNIANNNNNYNANVAAVELGVKQMGDRVEAQYNQDIKTQKDQHKRPSTPSYCINLYNWFPLRLFCFIGGVLLVTCTILDFIFNGDTFIQFILRIYLLFFGIIIMIIEAPTRTGNRFLQLKIFFWFRILSRMWGRALFYLFITILSFGEFQQENPAESTIVAGFYLMFIAILSFIVSKTSSNKYNRIFIYIASGSEGDILDSKFIQKYKELSKLNEQQVIGSYEINNIATQSGRVLSNAERYAIQTYLDESCNGFVSKEDWLKQFLKLKENKQRFL